MGEACGAIILLYGEHTRVQGMGDKPGVCSPWSLHSAPYPFSFVFLLTGHLPATRMCVSQGRDIVGLLTQYPQCLEHARHTKGIYTK